MNAIPGCLKSGIVVIFIIFPSKGKDFAKFVPSEGMNLADFVLFEGKLHDSASKNEQESRRSPELAAEVSAEV